MHKANIKAWLSLSLVLLSLFFAGWYILESDFKRKLAQTTNEANDELELLSILVKERLQKKNYQLAQNIISKWGNNSADIAAIRLKTNNGFELGRYSDGRVYNNTLVKRKNIDYSYDKTASLEVTWDIGEVYSSQRYFMVELLIGYSFIALVLFWLVKLNLRARQQTLVLEVENKRRIEAEALVLKANDALIQREKNLSITLNSIGDAVIATDAKGNVARMNPVAEALTGWKYKEAMGLSLKTILPIVDASTRKPIENPVEKVLATGKTIYLSNHTTLIAKDGTEYQIADSAAPIRNENNEIQGMVLVFNDVTEQYKLRAEINATAQHLQLYRQQAPLATIEWDVNFALIDWNKAAETMFGYTLEEIRGRNLFDCMALEKEAININCVDAELTDQAGSKQSIHEHVTKTGHTILCEWHYTLIKDEEGKVVGGGAIIQNITQQRRQEEQLRQSQKMDALGKLTGGVAHDYNNMLSIILGYSELLEDALVEQPELKKFSQAIHHASERGAKLTKRLLAFSHRKVTDGEVLNINLLLNDSRDMLSKTLTPRVELKFNLAADLWDIYVNTADLEDALINLCINAMHAMDEHGQLTIRTSNMTITAKEAVPLQITSGEYVLLSVTDTGCGMDTETKQRMFDPFYTTKGDGGTGLGLSQVYGFLERSNGAVKVYTELGHGTQFVFYFPRYQLNQTPISTSRPETDDAVYSGTETILVVDDEPALLDLTTRVLRHKGYRVLTAPGGEQALKILETETVQLVLSDVIMPGMDGYQFAKQVQQSYPLVKIQLASGFSDDRHKQMDDTSLHENLLYKPYHADVLLRKIRSLLDESNNE